MEKIKYLPLGLLVAYSLKALILGASLVDLGVISVLCTLAIFYEAKTEKKAISELRTQFTELKKISEEHKALQDKAIENTFKQFNEIKGFVNSVKMNQTMPGVRFGNGKTNVNY